MKFDFKKWVVEKAYKLTESFQQTADILKISRENVSCILNAKFKMGQKRSSNKKPSKRMRQVSRNKFTKKRGRQTGT
ncbi:MAG: hypothetical protein DMG05_06750 [Acidobacteria bacterium]|nr:MAG: hypothetical protein DMG05_06750 [Acidobacteriota bacterium]